MSIFVLKIRNMEEEIVDELYFSDLEKATSFINNNFAWDSIRRIDNELYEGKNNQYIIKENIINQLKI